MRGALASVALALVPLAVNAGDDGSASMKACAELLREEAKSADEPQRDRLLDTAKLYDLAARGFASPHAQGLNEMARVPMPRTIDDCLPDPKLTP